MLRDIKVNNIELLMCQHKEKLAITIGFLKTPLGIVIRVVKNLRVWDDYHIATKFISKIIARDIFVRDEMVHAFR